MSKSCFYLTHFNLHRLGDYGAPHGLTAKVIAIIIDLEKQGENLLRIEKPRILSTRTVDCELFSLAGCYLRDIGKVI